MIICTKCYDGMSCVGRNISDGVEANGYKSAYGLTTSIISTTGVISCGGALACYDISRFTATQRIECLGTYSCSNINGNSYIQTSKYNTKYPINCQASNSCQNTKIRPFNNSLGFIGCYGDHSCAYSDIQNVANIAGLGAYSLLYATINSNLSSNNTNQLVVSLRGYHAGFGATIICHAGDICTVKCSNNACHMLRYICLGIDNCIIDIRSSDTIHPIRNITEFNPNTLNLLYNSTETSSDNEEACNLPHNHYVYDDSWECSTDIVSISNNNNSNLIDPICCRGRESCANISYIITTNDIICSGARACEGRRIDKLGLIISTTGSVYCESFHACAGSTINSANNVYCLGAYSCEQTIIYNATNIYCSSKFSCNYTTIYSNGQGHNMNVYLLGQASAGQLNIHCNGKDDICSIFCGGYQSCQSTTRCIGAGVCIIDCNSDTGCPFTTTAIPTTSLPTLPSNNPTIGPSEVPTTISPTYYPSTIPTKVPSSSPEKEPTTSPTYQPSTNNPTTYLPTSSQPSIGTPTASPININSSIITSTTMYTTSQWTTLLFTSSSSISSTSSIVVLPSFMISACIITTFLFFEMISLIDAKCCRPNDYFMVGSIFTASFEVVDTVSDILFALYLTFKYEMNNDIYLLIVMIASYIFIIIPISFSIYQLMHQIHTTWIDMNWLKDTSQLKFLYLLSILTGSSYTAIQIVNCEAFSLNIFCMGLNKRERMYFNTKRIYGIVCLENIPQIAIQIWYLISFGIDLVPICSIIFSFISIILSVLTLFTQRLIIENQKRLIITFDVESDKITSKLIRKTNRIKSYLVKQLGKDTPIEIPKPRDISGHAPFKIELIVNNVDANEKKTIINNIIKNGELTKIIEDEWKIHVTITPPEFEIHPQIQIVHNVKKNQMELTHMNVNDMPTPHVMEISTTPGYIQESEESEENQTL